MVNINLPDSNGKDELYKKSRRICPKLVPFQQRSQNEITAPLSAANAIAPFEIVVSIAGLLISAVAKVSTTQWTYQCKRMA